MQLPWQQHQPFHCCPRIILKAWYSFMQYQIGHCALLLDQNFPFSLNVHVLHACICAQRWQQTLLTTFAWLLAHEHDSAVVLQHSSQARLFGGPRGVKRVSGGCVRSHMLVRSRGIKNGGKPGELKNGGKPGESGRRPAS